MIDDPLLSAWLHDHARGDLDREAGAALADVAEAVGLYRKAGTLTLTLRLDPSGARQVSVSGQIKTKAPDADAEVSLWFTSGAGLVKNDPLHTHLPGVEPSVLDAVPSTTVNDQEPTP